MAGAAGAAARAAELALSAPPGLNEPGELGVDGLNEAIGCRA